MQLRNRESWADRFLQKALSSSPVGVDDIPIKFLGVPPEAELPEELRGAQTYRYMHDFGQEMNRGKLPEIIFVNAVFAFECEIGDQSGDRSPALAECFKRRHKYAHSGGIADHIYLDKLSLSPLRDIIGPIQLGDRIPTTDETLLESVKVLLHEARSLENL